jgi:hypothetical protein
MTKRKAAKPKEADPIARRVRALLAFAHSEYFEEVMATLKENAWWNQGAFDAAGYDPYKAACVEGRQSLVKILEIELSKAEKWQRQSA